MTPEQHAAYLRWTQVQLELQAQLIQEKLDELSKRIDKLGDDVVTPADASNEVCQMACDNLNEAQILKALACPPGG